MDNAMNTGNPVDVAPAAPPAAPAAPVATPAPPAAPAAPVAGSNGLADEDWTTVGLQLAGVVALFTVTYYFWWKKKTAAAQVTKQDKQIGDLKEEVEELQRAQKKAVKTQGRNLF